MNHRIPIFSGLLLAAVCGTPAHKARAGSTPQPVPILAWHSIPENELSLERFRELADAGFTHSLMHYSPEGNARALELAAQTGLKLFVGDQRFEKPGEALEAASRAYRDHPALAGYLLRDEPSVAAFAALAAARDALQAADPGHWSYVNLLPTYASPAQLGCSTYVGHVRRFLAEFRPGTLSFDHYPILQGNRLRGDFFQNLEWIRQCSQEFDKPFWAFALSCPHRPYPMPTLEHLRLQAWSNFAYGAKGLQYFTYWTPRPGTWDFHDAPIRLDGTRSGTYDLVRAFNREVQAAAAVIMTSRAVAVYHTDPVPTGARGLDVSCPFSDIQGGEVLVGLHVVSDRERYALLVNRSLSNTATLRLEFQAWVSTVSWEPRIPGAELLEVAGRNARLRLEPGAAAFLRLAQN